ncbi:MAG TPA: glucoamylase family protein [Terriglobales bacterium]|nr:glucoamylase family protein [Terriglobales bacterium]
MAANNRVELTLPGAGTSARTYVLSSPELNSLRVQALQLSNSLVAEERSSSPAFFRLRYRELKRRLSPVLAQLPVPGQLDDEGNPRREALSAGMLWLRDNAALLQGTFKELQHLAKDVQRLPQVRRSDGITLPRVIAVLEGYLPACSSRLCAEELVAFVDSFQDCAILEMREIWALVPVLKLVLLEQVASAMAQTGEKFLGEPLFYEPVSDANLTACLQSLRTTAQISWKEILEPLIRFDRVLQQDPAGSYCKMDFESRDAYRAAIVHIAERCELSEIDVAMEALSLARESRHFKSRYLHDSYAGRNRRPGDGAGSEGGRLELRRSHIGYYLLEDEGIALLHRRTNFRPTAASRLRSIVRRYPSALYVSSIALLTAALVLPLVIGTASHGALLWTALAALLLAVTCSQTAVELINSFVTTLLPPRSLPKLDFSDGVSDDCATMVAVPCLLLNEAQVHRLVEDLEVRYLGNRDPNIHFALLTDLPESQSGPDNDDPLVELCARLVSDLAAKYADHSAGTFFLLHRDRVYEPAENLWIGWERKRGKLLELNRLLRGSCDSFPVKVGSEHLLRDVRYVITLDSDTELPRGSAHRMIGAMRHPLNRAVLNAASNTVVAGYGVLQPRVSVNAASATLSRFTGIYSGQTGLDLYTRAVSDVYQDLYGEGIFTGKGIYEVEIFHRVLDSRFPRNTLLSHDLLEGAYARAGLLSDVELFDDYPSNFNAYNRRKHRWLRGDWQVVPWLFPVVRDEAGSGVANPLSFVARWKIFDNLRRSLIEPCAVLALLMAWLLLPASAARWTIAICTLPFLPTSMRLLAATLQSIRRRKLGILREAASAWALSALHAVIFLVFLLNQSLVSLDAIARTMVRFVTRKRLLQWETAAEAELAGGKRTHLQFYLDWTPACAAAMSLLVLYLHPGVFPFAAPVLLLWSGSSALSSWLNRPPRTFSNHVSQSDRTMLRAFALKTWRYFATYSNAEHNWLVPDHVQESPASVAPVVSPTNLGLLLNSRQAACEFGYLTVPQFASQTLATLKTLTRLPKYRGHLLNWYDTRTLQPLMPMFVSSVDSGNFVASLWSLEQGSIEQLSRPLFSSGLADGLIDHIHALRSVREIPGEACSELDAFEQELGRSDWVNAILQMTPEALERICDVGANPSPDAEWFAGQLKDRVLSIWEMVQLFMPWQLPEFDSLRCTGGLRELLTAEAPSVEEIPEFIAALSAALPAAASHPDAARAGLCSRLQMLLPFARHRTESLIHDLRAIATTTGKFAGDMEFGFLLDSNRKLLSIGFDVESRGLHSSCYDLLASEARTAVFIAIAKEDLPQDTWFLLGRAHTLHRGQPVLLSWTGTIFEYLMPGLWMRTSPNSLLGRSRSTAVKVQQSYANKKGIPWGISESGHYTFDEAGTYQYAPFGVPALALNKGEREPLVVSPYSSFLALEVDAQGVARNLRQMADSGLLGAHGFYEAADYSAPGGTARAEQCRVVSSWMAHHQGMTLLALVNYLRDGVVQRWFHASPWVQATESLLQNKPVFDKASCLHVSEGVPPGSRHMGLTGRTSAKKLSLAEKIA